MAYNQFDVIVVPFPFSDTSGTKRRPAVVVSSDSAFNTPAGHSVCLMVTTTTAAWTLDLPISDLAPTGLKTPCKMRMKMFTIDNALIAYKAGALSAKDQAALKKNLNALIP